MKYLSSANPTIPPENAASAHLRTKKVLAFCILLCYTLRHSFPGGIAQLVERLNGIQKVRSSTLLTSTIKKEAKMGKGEQGSPFLLFLGERRCLTGV